MAEKKAVQTKQEKLILLEEKRESIVIASYERVLEHFAKQHGMPFSTELARLKGELEPVEAELAKLKGKAKVKTPVG